MQGGMLLPPCEAVSMRDAVHGMRLLCMLLVGSFMWVVSYLYVHA
jgi:hypothetical protein